LWEVVAAPFLDDLRFRSRISVFSSSLRLGDREDPYPM
jgi:hypothetical protein